MRALLNVAAPAKLNLSLRITGRRADGYHCMDSLFVLIDWQDTLHFELLQSNRIERRDLTWPLPAEDLILRAARALQAAGHVQTGVRIAVEKRIPQGAGLGGGSSDAASTLLVLNHLWHLHWPWQKLAQIGQSLGADIPFFLSGAGAARVQGIGEQVTPHQRPEQNFYVLHPALTLDTRSVYQCYDESPWAFRGVARIRRLFSAATMHNDLQPAALHLCPSIGDALRWLSAQPGLLAAAQMTGSGSAVFAPVSAGVSLTAPEIWAGRHCKTYSEHPFTASFSKPPQGSRQVG